MSIAPDPNHVVALALSGALPVAQAGEILMAAFAPNKRKPYACHNNPRPVAGAVTHQAQAGWEGDHYHNAMPGTRWIHPTTRIPKLVPIHHTMSTTCQYDKGTTDPRCAGCEHIKQGDV